MSTQVTLTDFIGSLASTRKSPDQSRWSALQKMQFELGMWDGMDGSPVRLRELPEWNWTPNGEWRKLEGLLADHPEHG